MSCLHSFTKIQFKSQCYRFKIKTSTHFQNLQSNSLGKYHYSNVKLVERNEGTTSKKKFKENKRVSYYILLAFKVHVQEILIYDSRESKHVNHQLKINVKIV